MRVAAIGFLIPIATVGYCLPVWMLTYSYMTTGHRSTLHMLTYLGNMCARAFPAYLRLPSYLYVWWVPTTNAFNLVDQC
jgi:hypothetical protein